MNTLTTELHFALKQLWNASDEWQKYLIKTGITVNTSVVHRWVIKLVGVAMHPVKNNYWRWCKIACNGQGTCEDWRKVLFCDEICFIVQGQLKKSVLVLVLATTALNLYTKWRTHEFKTLYRCDIKTWFQTWNRCSWIDLGFSSKILHHATDPWLWPNPTIHTNVNHHIN